MGIAYTNRPTTHTLLAAAPPLTFLDNLRTLLLSVGWEYLNDYENGTEYLITSPQNLKARVRIWYPNAAPYADCFALQTASAATPDTLTGYTHHFLAGYTGAFPGDDRIFSHYWVWANCCQLFIGANHPDSFKGGMIRAVECGVPHSYQATTPTPECTRYTPAPNVATELFFSAGDDNGTGMTADAVPNFRTSYFCGRYTLIFNGQDFSATIGNPLPGVEANALQLDILRTNVDWDGLYDYFLHRGFTRPDGTPLAYDPLMSYQGYIFGELWDACCLTIPMTLEANEEIFDSETGILTRWINYASAHGVFITTARRRDEGRAFSLLLLIDPPEQIEAAGINVAY